MPAIQDKRKTLAALLKEQVMLEAVRDALQSKVNALRKSGETRVVSAARAKIAKLTKKK